MAAVDAEVVETEIAVDAAAEGGAEAATAGVTTELGAEAGAGAGAEIGAESGGGVADFFAGMDAECAGTGTPLLPGVAETPLLPGVPETPLLPGVPEQPLLPSFEPTELEPMTKAAMWRIAGESLAHYIDYTGVALSGYVAAKATMNWYER